MCHKLFMLSYKSGVTLPQVTAKNKTPPEAALAQVALNGIGAPIARLPAWPSVLIGNNLQKRAHRKQTRPHSERGTGSSVPISGPPSPCHWHEPIPQWVVVLQISPQTVYCKMTGGRRISLRRTPTPQSHDGSYFCSSSNPSSPDHDSTRPNQRRPPSSPT